MPPTDDTMPRWFVMRDLKRANALAPAYRQLRDAGIEVFVPMKWRLKTRQGKRVREEAPLVCDLLFVREARCRLDPIVERTPTLQYRWLRHTFREPMTVGDTEMGRFIAAVQASESPIYFLPEEITPQMCRRRVRIVGGKLDGYEGFLLTTKGSRVKRLLVELPGVFAAGVEVSPDYIQLL